MTQNQRTTIVTWLATVFLLGAFTVMLALKIEAVEDKLEMAEIAGTRVPPVSCAEDEVIWWTEPDTLGCVHFEEAR